MCRSTIAPTARPVNAYVIRPLFSKWGATDLGMADGGVRVFYDESLSGVIQWVFAAPLFSINLFFLTALMQRSLKPLRQLASFEGLDLLIENAVRVLRWGLWTAPVIYSFLKASPDPTTVQPRRVGAHGRREYGRISTCRRMSPVRWSSIFSRRCSPSTACAC